MVIRQQPMSLAPSYRLSKDPGFKGIGLLLSPAKGLGGYVFNVVELGQLGACWG